MTFDEQFKAYYREQQLDEEAIQRMTRRFRSRKPIKAIHLALAASLLLAIAAWLQTTKVHNGIDYIASEVAMNHNKHLAVEVATGDIRELGKQLGKLDFPLLLPKAMKDQGHILLGGRYCSLHGQLAAQIKLKRTKDNEILTLYATRQIPMLTKALPSSETVDGVQVRLWSENGLFYSLAETAAP